MCDLLSQPRQQQQRTGQKLSNRQLNKNQLHLTTTTTTSEMSSNLCTNSNRFNNSMINTTNNRSSKSLNQQTTQKSDINSFIVIDKDTTTDNVDSSSTDSINQISWSPPNENSNSNHNNTNNHSRRNSSSKDHIHVSSSINGDLQQPQQQDICSTTNETLNTDMNDQCSIITIEQSMKTSIHFDCIDNSNQSNSIGSSKSPRLSTPSPAPSPSSSSSSSTASASISNHSVVVSLRNNENAQWNTTTSTNTTNNNDNSSSSNVNNDDDDDVINSCTVKSQTDIIDKLNSPNNNHDNVDDHSSHVQPSSSSSQSQNRRQLNKSNLSAYHNKECQQLSSDKEVEIEDDNEVEDNSVTIDFKNDCTDKDDQNHATIDEDGGDGGDGDDVDGGEVEEDNDGTDHDDNDDNNNNSYLINQHPTHPYVTSFPTLITSDNLTNCISPMLAAAAMAALTTGCFPTSCNQLNQFNYSLLSKSYGISQLSAPPPPPPLTTLLPPPQPSMSSLSLSPSPSAYPQRLHTTTTTKQQSSFFNSTPNKNSKLNGTHHHPHPHQHNVHMNSLSSSSSSSSVAIVGGHSANSPIQSNTDHYNNNNKTHPMSSTSPCTPMQYSSRSNSPHQASTNHHHQHHRFISSSNALNYFSSMNDDVEGEEEENDDDDDEVGGSDDDDDDELDADGGGDEMDKNSSTPGNTNTNNNNNHQWTFEEQFKQLYVISDDPKRKEFLDELFVYMQRRGTPVNRIPIMAKQVLDLYELFQLVVARGGLVEVINKKLWREITKGLNLPSSITSAAFTLRTQYMKYLYPYECETLGLSSPNELQAAIDGNRREARRSSYTFDYPMMNAPNTSRSTSPASVTTAEAVTTITTTATTMNTTTTNHQQTPTLTTNITIPANIMTPTTTTTNTSTSSLSSSFIYPNGLGFPYEINSDMNQLLANIAGDSTNTTTTTTATTTPFCTNHLNFTTPFAQFNPFLTIPTGCSSTALENNAFGLQPPITAMMTSTTTTTSSLSTATTVLSNPMNFFPAHLLPSMIAASHPNFSIIGGGSHFQGFNTASLNHSDDVCIPSASASASSSSSSSTSSMIQQPGLSVNNNNNNNFTDPNNAMAAAVAAATLFSAGFPTLPGGFTATHTPTTPPPVPMSLPFPPSLTPSLQSPVSIPVILPPTATSPTSTVVTTLNNNSYLVNNTTLMMNQSDEYVKFPLFNSIRQQMNHSNSTTTDGGLNDSGLRSKNKLIQHNLDNDDDDDDCQFTTSSLPLNLTANETNLIKLDEEGSLYLDNDCRSSLMLVEHDKKLNLDNDSFTLHSNDQLIQKDGGKNNHLLNSYHHHSQHPQHQHRRRQHHQHQHQYKETTTSAASNDDDGDEADHDDPHDNDADDCSTSVHNEQQHIELRCQSNSSGDMNKREQTTTATSSSTSSNTTTTTTNSNNNNRLPQANFTFENDDPSIKTAAQVACQQLWAAAAAAAAGLQHCSHQIKTSEKNTYGMLTGNFNGLCKSNHASSQQIESSNSIPAASTTTTTTTTTTPTSTQTTTTIHNNISSNNKQTSHSTYSKSLTSSTSGKKTHSRTPSHLDTPNAKIPKLSFMNNNTSGIGAHESNGKHCGTNLSKKLSDLRKQNEAISMSANFHFNNNTTNTTNNSSVSVGANNNHLSAAQLSMVTQNFRIQTQPGAPMGLPQNAMVVTMEMGNLLYQGVLFGQLKR
ncbi:unnamed protein product [Schistosoma turkestanicum]|nr:unnamed protein product [Schistosoma turkestanicum]